MFFPFICSHLHTCNTVCLHQALCMGITWIPSEAFGWQGGCVCRGEQGPKWEGVWIGVDYCWRAATECDWHADFRRVGGSEAGGRKTDWVSVFVRAHSAYEVILGLWICMHMSSCCVGAQRVWESSFHWANQCIPCPVCFTHTWLWTCVHVMRHTSGLN